MIGRLGLAGGRRILIQGGRVKPKPKEGLDVFKKCIERITFSRDHNVEAMDSLVQDRQLESKTYQTIIKIKDASGYLTFLQDINLYMIERALWTVYNASQHSVI